MRMPLGMQMTVAVCGLGLVAAGPASGLTLKEQWKKTIERTAPPVALFDKAKGLCMCRDGVVRHGIGYLASGNALESDDNTYASLCLVPRFAGSAGEPVGLPELCVDWVYLPK